MKLLKLFFLAFPVFLASILMVANPANASIKTLSNTQLTTVEYVQPVADIVVPHLALGSHPITEQLSCNCANCAQSKLQLLQGKLPSVNF